MDKITQIIRSDFVGTIIFIKGIRQWFALAQGLLIDDENPKLMEIRGAV